MRSRFGKLSSTPSENCVSGNAKLRFWVMRNCFLGDAKLFSVQKNSFHDAKLVFRRCFRRSMLFRRSFDARNSFGAVLEQFLEQFWSSFFMSKNSIPHRSCSWQLLVVGYWSAILILRAWELHHLACVAVARPGSCLFVWHACAHA